LTSPTPPEKRRGPIHPRGAAPLGEKERSPGRAVFAREIFDLAREVVKREVEVQRRRVLLDEAARLAPVIVRDGLDQSHSRSRPAESV
jgi:hypothetical protein